MEARSPMIVLNFKVHIDLDIYIVRGGKWTNMDELVGLFSS